MAIFPSPAEIAAQTPANRDRAIDVIRIVSLVAVVFGHTIMAVSTVRDGVFVWGNLLESLPALGALTWVLQIMPLFFFAGTAASVESWYAGGSWGGWLMQRCTRLYRPVFFYLAFWGVALAVLRFVLPKHVYEPVAGTSIQLLWFLGVALGCSCANRSAKQRVAIEHQRPASPHRHRRLTRNEPGWAARESPTACASRSKRWRTWNRLVEVDRSDSTAEIRPRPRTHTGIVQRSGHPRSSPPLESEQQ